MATSEKSKTYPVGPDEKSASILIYTANAVLWGDVVVKEIFRVSTWLRTNSAPDNLTLYDAKMIMTATGAPRPLSLPEIHISLTQIWGYHLLPPAKDPLDYDPAEPNRKLEPVTAIVGNFRMDGMMRMASIMNLGRYLEVARESFTGLYDVSISSPVLTSLGTMQVPFMLVRQATALFSTRSA